MRFWEFLLGLCWAYRSSLSSVRGASLLLALRGAFRLLDISVLHQSTSQSVLLSLRACFALTAWLLPAECCVSSFSYVTLSVSLIQRVKAVMLIRTGTSMEEALSHHVSTMLRGLLPPSFLIGSDGLAKQQRRLPGQVSSHGAIVALLRSYACKGQILYRQVVGTYRRVGADRLPRA